MTPLSPNCDTASEGGGWLESLRLNGVPKIMAQIQDHRQRLDAAWKHSRDSGFLSPCPWGKTIAHANHREKDSHPQVALPGLEVVLQVLSRTIELDRPLLYYVDPIAKAQGKILILFGQENRYGGRLKFLDLLAQML